MKTKKKKKNSKYVLEYTLEKKYVFLNFNYNNLPNISQSKYFENPPVHEPLHVFGTGDAKTCLMPYANYKGADQPAHPLSLISTFVVRCLDSMICVLAISKVSRF